MYCIEVWGSTTKGNIVSLLKLQKRILRIIKSVPTRTDSAPLFLDLGILLLFKVYMMKLAVVAFKSYHGFSIESIKELFTGIQIVHDGDTRQSSKYYVPFTRKEIVRKSFKYRAAKLWNGWHEWLTLFLLWLYPNLIICQLWLTVGYHFCFLVFLCTLFPMIMVWMHKKWG